MKPSLKKNVYHHIRSKLLSRELPPGAVISHRKLAKEIGVSFTPVREAIGQLTNEGLLECHPNRGTYVSELSRQDLAELYDIREAQECHAVGKAAGRLAEADLSEMDRLTDEMAAVTVEVRRSGSPHWDIELADRWMIADAAFQLGHIAGGRQQQGDEDRQRAKRYGPNLRPTQTGSAARRPRFDMQPAPVDHRGFARGQRGRSTWDHGRAYSSRLPDRACGIRSQPH